MAQQVEHSPLAHQRGPGSNAVGSLPCSKRFPLQLGSGFPLSFKTNTSKFGLLASAPLVNKLQYKFKTIRAHRRQGKKHVQETPTEWDRYKIRA